MKPLRPRRPGQGPDRRQVMAAAAAAAALPRAAQAQASATAVTAINHVSMAVRNVYEAAHRLRAETGLGFYDGGWSRTGLAARIFPLGGGAYLIMEGVVDPFALQADGAARRHLESVREGEVFRGFCLRAAGPADLAAAARRNGLAPPPAPAPGRILPDGEALSTAGVPPIAEAWPRGLPNWNWFPQFNRHPSGRPTIAAPGLKAPLGVAWIEVGGAQAAMHAWTGLAPGVLPLRFNGGPPGVYAVAVNTDQGEVVVRRRPATSI